MPDSRPLKSPYLGRNLSPGVGISAGTGSTVPIDQAGYLNPDLAQAMKSVDDSFSNNGRSYVDEHRKNLIDLQGELEKVLGEQRDDLTRLENKIADNELAMRAVDAGIDILAAQPSEAGKVGGPLTDLIAEIAAAEVEPEE